MAGLNQHGVPHPEVGTELLPGPTEYHEVSTTQAILTKTGDEGPMSDDMSVDERPVSSGTMNSAAYEADNADDDEALLAANTAVPMVKTLGLYGFGAGNRTVFARPDSPTAIEAAPAFSYHTPANCTRACNAEELSRHRQQEGVHAQPQHTKDQVADDVDVVEVTSVRALPLTSPKIPAVHQASSRISAWPRSARYVDRRKRKRPKQRDHPSNDAAAACFRAPAFLGVQQSMAPDVIVLVDSGHDGVTHGELDELPTGAKPTYTGNGDHNTAVLHQDSTAATPVAAHHDNGQLHSSHQLPPAGGPVSIGHDTLHRGSGQQRPIMDEHAITAPRSYPQQNMVSESSSPRASDFMFTAARNMLEKENKSLARDAATKADMERQVQALNISKQNLETKLRGEHAVAMDLVKQKADQELGLAREAEHQLQRELHQAAREKDELISRVEQLKLTEDRVKGMKKFVDGLGNDLNKFRNTSNELHKKAVDGARDLNKQLEVHKNELGASLAREQSLIASVKEGADRLRAADVEIKTASNHLAIERDRRTQLEQQLSSISESKEEVLRAIESSSGQILGDLSTIHAMVDEGRSDGTVSEMLQSALKTIRGIESSTSGTADGVLLVRDSIEQLIKKFDDYVAVGDDAVESEEPSGLTTLQSHLDRSLTKLKGDLCQTDKLLKQDADHRETIIALQEQLKASQLRSDTATSQLNASRQTEGELKQHNTTLQSQLYVLKSSSTPIQEAHVQLNEAYADLEVVKQALQTAEGDLASKSDELYALTPANAQLAEQLQTMQVRVEELQAQATDFDREREGLQQKAHDNEQSIRNEMREHVEQVEMHLRAESRNDLKKLQSERNRLYEQVKSLQNDLESANDRLNRVQPDQSLDMAPKQGLERTRKHTETQKQEIDALKASLATTQGSMKDGEAVNQQHTTVSTQLTAEQLKLEAALAEISDLKEKCAQKDKSLRSSERTAAEAKEEEEQRTAAGLEHYKASCREAIDEAVNKGERRAVALQKSLSESQAELEVAKASGAKFRTEVENSWKQEQDSYDERIAELNHKLTESEQQRDEAQGKFNQVQSKMNAFEAERNASNEQLSEMQRRVEVAEASLKKEQNSNEQCSEMQRRVEVAEASLKRKTATSIVGGPTPPAARDDITPTTTARVMEPTKPRKILDRSTGLVPEVGRILVPEALRPKSRRSMSSGSRSESRMPHHNAMQPRLESFGLQPFGNGDTMRSSVSPGMDPILKIRDDACPRLPSAVVEETGLDDIFKYRDHAFTHPSAVVEEIQIDDGFGLWHDSSARSPAVVKETQLFSQPPGRDISQAFSEIIPFSSHSGLGKTHQASTDFAIYEDSQDRDRSLDSTDLQEHSRLQDTLSWSQAEKDKYTFQKPVAHPNSASKRVHLPAASSSNVRHSTVYGAKSDVSGVRRASTPHQHNVLRRNGSNLSSSPSFVQDSQANSRQQNTYQSIGNSLRKHKPSRTSSNTIADPRLLSRNPAAMVQKRKLEIQAIGNPVPAAKKRELSGSAATERYGRFPNGTSTTLQSMSTGSRRSSQHSTSIGREFTHMRTLDGNGSRQLRSAKKRSKHNEINTRLSQELSLSSRRR